MAYMVSGSLSCEITGKVQGVHHWRRLLSRERAEDAARRPDHGRAGAAPPGYGHAANYRPGAR